VIARLFSLEENVSKQSVKKKIGQAVEALLDYEEPWITAEALIELGATICTPKPRCEICPLSKNCLGMEKAHLLPIKNEEPKIILLKRAVLWIEAQGKVLVKKGEKGKVMEDLYQFPYFEMDELWGLAQVKTFIEKTFDIQPIFIKKLPLVSHTFTKYKATLYPFRFGAENFAEVPGHEWIERSLLSTLPFSSGHKRLLEL
jgi:A/G-specific adenine glycosylase